jgi:hypothetical protein
LTGLYNTVELPDHRVLQLEASNTSYRTESQKFVPARAAQS